MKRQSRERKVEQTKAGLILRLGFHDLDVRKKDGNKKRRENSEGDSRT